MSADQEEIAATARRFALARLAPNAAEWEEQGALDRPTLKEMAGLGFGGIVVREDAGGAALGRLEAALVFENLARGCVSTAAFMSIHNMSAWMLDRFGSAELRARFLGRVVAMDAIASYCLTEPGSGSDAASLKTSARREGDHYVLNGAKAFISGAGFSDLYLV
ncbi:MAG TPA: acyl-CoA dehydrogenase family protein, partial [Caulobacterales bacterium]|nr:acyl-CoA dehydrogenase family protein [Caulobacterales bacterium]